MKKTIFLLLLFIVIGSGWFYFWLHSDKAVPVTVIRAEMGAITATLNATGKVVSKLKVEISSPVSALVEDVFVTEGDRVKKGAVLACLDGRELKERLKAAESSLRAAEERTRQASRELKALETVYGAGGVSRQTVEDAKSGLEIAQAGADRALAELRADRIALDKRTLTAPIPGIITRKDIASGEWVTPGVPILSMSSENRREIEAMIDESDAGKLRVGQSAELSCDGYPGMVWSEKVIEIAPAVRLESNANSIRIRLSFGSEAPELKLGQQVDVNIETAHRESVVIIPFETIITRGGNQFVAKIVDGHARFVQIVTGIEDALSVEIKQGITVGDEIIQQGGKRLIEGEKVTAVHRESSGS